MSIQTFRCREPMNDHDWREVEAWDAKDAAEEYVELMSDEDFEFLHHHDGETKCNDIEVEGHGLFEISVDYEPVFTANRKADAGDDL